MIERTLVLVKPDAVERGLVGEIIQRFEHVGLKIVGMKMVWVDETFASKHYFDIKERRGEKVYNSLMNMITMGPVVAVVLEGISAVEVVRKMCGPTEPKSAMPGTIRGDYAHVSFAYSDKVNEAVRNVVHSSGNLAEAEAEIALWFSWNEIYDYESVHDMHILHKKATEIKKAKGYKPQEDNA